MTAEISAPPAFRLAGRDPARAALFPSDVLLAPMDGVTDRLFRELVLDLGDAGGACTEFVRVSIAPVPKHVFVRELGAAPRPRPGRPPVAAQIMAPGEDHLAETVANADLAGADWIDLNFGCPVKRVFNKCAGSALLAHPERLARIVETAVGATTLAVTAKIRAGVDDASLLDDVLDACVGAGASGVTVHARLRRHSYDEPAQWEWIAHAAERLHAARPGIVVIGNGGIEQGADAGRMRQETGCDAVMIGRAAVADPFVFREARGGPPATREESRRFARNYLDALGHSRLDSFWPGSCLEHYRR